MKYITIINSNVLNGFSNRKIISRDELQYFDSISDIAIQLENLLSTRQAEVNDAAKLGFEEGYYKGLENGLEDLKEKFRDFLKDAYDKMHSDILQTQKAAIELACEMTRKIAEDIPKEDLISSLTKTALMKVGEHPFYEITVNASNAAILQDRIVSMASAKQTSTTSIRMNIDSSLGDLDCHIKTSAGTTIANFDDQIALLRNHIVTHLDRVLPNH